MISLLLAKFLWDAAECFLRPVSDHHVDDFSFWAERLSLRASHSGGGREYIVVHLHSYSYKISHSLHEISQSSWRVFFQFRWFGMLGF